MLFYFLNIIYLYICLILFLLTFSLTILHLTTYALFRFILPSQTLNFHIWKTSVAFSDTKLVLKKRKIIAQHTILFSFSFPFSIPLLLPFQTTQTTFVKVTNLSFHFPSFSPLLSFFSLLILSIPTALLLTGRE